MMTGRLSSLLLLLSVGGVVVASGCTELAGRKRIQEGTAAYKAGDFAGAVARFEEAEKLVPSLPVLWLNKGYACRELITPGAASSATRAQNRRWGDCALSAFKQFRRLSPADPRGDRLFVQTLFDLGAYERLESTFRLRHEKEPRNLDDILVLQQVYYRMGRWREALVYYRKAAALRPSDAETQYAVGTFIWQVLSKHGGDARFERYDPRPRPEALTAQASSAGRKRGAAPPPPAVAPAPAAGPDDVSGAERMALADEGIRYLQRALTLRPGFHEAMTYVGLLYRQRSFAQFGDPTGWQQSVDQAVVYANRATERR